MCYRLKQSKSKIANIFRPTTHEYANVFKKISNCFLMDNIDFDALLLNALKMTKTIAIIIFNIII